VTAASLSRPGRRSEPRTGSCFVFLLIRTKLSKFTPAQATSAIVVSYYWHFVDVVWIGLFTTIYIIH